MKRIRAFVLIGAAFLGLGWAAFQAVAPVEPLSKYFPPGALLYLQTSDFLALLADWNASPQKQEWLRSSNYEVFSRSRLLLKSDPSPGGAKELRDWLSFAPPGLARDGLLIPRACALGLYLRFRGTTRLG
jgi:hypothetical protein